LLCAAAPAAGADVLDVGPDVPGGYASTHVIVRLRPGVRPLELPAAGGAPGAAARARLTLAGPAAPGAGLQRFDPVAEALQRWNVTGIKPVFENGFADARLAGEIGLDRWYRLRTPQGTDTPALIAELSRFPALIERAELDGIGGVADVIPDDPDFDIQWGLLNTGQDVDGVAGAVGADINICPGWEITVGDETLVLAVLDAGMDEHDELVNRMIRGRNVAADPDNDDTSDVCGSHGTHVAGIAGAASDNGQGIAGVDWSCRIMPVRVLNSCSGPASYLAEGIVWAANHDADVINISLQYPTGTTQLHDAVLYAHGQGVVMIAAAGNNSPCDEPSVRYPALWPETVAAAAINNQGERADSSNCGPQLDVAAPGESIWSLRDVSDYQFRSGTSMATAHVSGTVCLMKALDPELSPDEIRLILQTTAVDIGDPGFDNETGHGRVNANAALLEAQGGQVPGDIDGDGSVGITDFLILLGAWGPCPDPPDPCSADLDGDGSVGITDMLILLGNWG
jgi:subtilisin family serine protease